MIKNMGSADKLIRLIIAGLVAVLYFTHVLNGVLGLVLLILAAVSAVAALVGSCPLYLPLGINTAKKKKQ